MSPRLAARGEPRPARRWWRWLFWTLGCALGGVAAALLAVQALLHLLDAPWLKGRLLAAARRSAGIDVDYRVARADLFSGLHVEDLVVRTPAEKRSFAPELLRLGRLDARFCLGGLLLGKGAAIERVELSDLAVTLVVDEEGKTSLDPLLPPASSEPPPTALSRLAAKQLAKPLPLGGLVVDRVTLELVRTDHGKVSERTALRGLALALAARSAAPTPGWRVDAHLGSPQAPLELALTQARSDEPTLLAHARLWVTAGVDSRALTTALDLRVQDQTFATSVSADHWLHADLGLRFEPGAGRTEVSIERVEAGDGAAIADAAIDVPDAGDPVVHHARADVDLARLLHWLPPGLVPVTAGQAHVRVLVRSLEVGTIPRLAPEGAATIDADLDDVAVRTAGGPITLSNGVVSLRAEPSENGGLSARGSVKLAGAKLVSGRERLEAEGLGVDLDGHRDSDGTIRGRARVDFARLALAGPSSVRADRGHLEATVNDLRPDPEALLASHGDLSLSFDLASLDARSPASQATADELTVHAHTAWTGSAPYAGELQARARRLRLALRDGRVDADAPLQFDARVRNLEPDAVHPQATRGAIHASVVLGDLQSSLEATNDAAALDFSVRASGRSLKAVRPFLPAGLVEQAPWERLSFALKANGRVERLGTPRPFVREETVLDMDRPAFGGVSAQSLALHLSSRGDAFQHQGEVDLKVPGLTWSGVTPSDDHLTLSATADREHPSLQFRLATEGRAVSTLSGAFAFDPARRAVTYATDGHLAGLAPLAPLLAHVRALAGFDLSALEVAVSARGVLSGVVDGVTQDGRLQLEPAPARTASIEGDADLRLSKLRWTQGDTAISTPALVWHGDFHRSEQGHVLASRLEVGALKLGFGRHEVDVSGVRDASRVVVAGNLDNPEIELNDHLSMATITQDLAPEVPIGDVTFALNAARGPEGVIHVSDLKLQNALGGMALALDGNVDLGGGRRTLSINTSLTQDLSRLTSIPEFFQGKGSVGIDATITSPDLTLYNVRAAAKGKDVSVRFSRAGVDLDTVNGEVPIEVALEVGEHGLELQRSPDRSPYSMLRFTDQHPLLTRSGFLSIQRLKTPFVSIAPLVGNLAIEQNIVSLRQFEMGVRGGTITGQCGLDWDGPRSTVELHVRASGVQSSHGEPFDGNIAVTLSAADRTIEGRAEILRIGERHLLDLLDLQDPLHVDPAMNRIRGALVFGYPDTLRLVFDHGFANARLQLGGLARLISISELRGIPIGPLVDKMIARMLDAPEAKEAP